MDIQQQLLPECDLPTEEKDGTTAKVGSADDASATPYNISVEMLAASSSTVSTERSYEDSAFASTRSDGEELPENDDDLLDLFVEILDTDFDHDLIL